VTLVASLLAVLAGCPKAPVPMRPPLSHPTAERADVIDTNIENGWIQVTVQIPRGHPGPRPAVITPIVADSTLLERGIAVVRYHTNWEALAPLRPPEPVKPPGPELQVGSWLLTAPRPGIVGKAYFALITQDAERSVPRVVDFLATVPQLDPARLAIAGSSTSGFLALQAMAADRRLALGVVRVACGDYHRFLRDSNLGLDSNPRWLVDGQMVLDADYEAELERIEPIRAAARFPPRPLLLVTGAEDPAIPADCARSTAKRFAAAYAAAGVRERFDFVELAGQGHNLSDASERLAVDWWERWLLGTEPLLTAGAEPPRGGALLFSRSDGGRRGGGSVDARRAPRG
jgi:dienelactone hydrolase